MKLKNENEIEKWKVRMKCMKIRELFAFKKMNITTKPKDKTDGCLFQKLDREIS